MSMLPILKSFLLCGLDGRKAIQRIAQPQPEGLRSSGLGATPQQAENHLFRGCGIDGFLHWLTKVNPRLFRGKRSITARLASPPLR